MTRSTSFFFIPFNSRWHRVVDGLWLLFALLGVALCCEGLAMLYEGLSLGMQVTTGQDLGDGSMELWSYRQSIRQGAPSLMNSGELLSATELSPDDELRSEYLCWVGAHRLFVGLVIMLAWVIYWNQVA